MQLALGKVRARARATNPATDASPQAASQYQLVAVETVRTDEFGNYPAVSSPFASPLERVDITPAWDRPGLTPDPQVNLLPAAGSENLTRPRDAGGRPGTQRLNRSVGPVIGPTSAWTGNRDRIPEMVVGQAGPVGVLDYSSQLSAAYLAANRAVFDQAAAESALVASV